MDGLSGVHSYVHGTYTSWLTSRPQHRKHLPRRRWRVRPGWITSRSARWSTPGRMSCSATTTRRRSGGSGSSSARSGWPFPSASPSRWTTPCPRRPRGTPRTTPRSARLCAEQGIAQLLRRGPRHLPPGAERGSPGAARPAHPRRGLAHAPTTAGWARSGPASGAARWPRSGPPANSGCACPSRSASTLEGALPVGVTAKDFALRIIGDLGADGGLYASVEFSGSGIDALSIDSRMVLPNMMAEFGAKNAWIGAG